MTAAVVVAVVLAFGCSDEGADDVVGGLSGHNLWGPPSDAEVAAARELQLAYVGGSTDVFPPIDPDAPCPNGVPDGESLAVVFRVRRGCLWSQRAHEEWLLTSRSIDHGKYFDSDPFIVAVKYVEETFEQFMPTWYMVLVETDEYRCHREIPSYIEVLVSRWDMLEILYRNPAVVESPGFARYPWHEDAPECPLWVSLAPGYFQWGLPTRVQAADARELQAQFVGRPPGEWPPLPEAPGVCPLPQWWEFQPSTGMRFDLGELTVFRHRGGCLIAERGPAVVRFRPGVDGPWDVYDYESDPWAIWACTRSSSDLASVGCDSGLAHNAHIAELHAAHSPDTHRIDPTANR